MSQELDRLLETRSEIPSRSSDDVEARSKSVNTSAASRQVAAVMRRYGDAYLVARSTNGFGILIKIIAVIVGALLIVIGAFLFNDGRETAPLGLAAIALGVVVGVLFYLLGILVSAQGQILKASLDAAVNTSPFLTNTDRATIMSLPKKNPNETKTAENIAASKLTPSPKKAAVDASGFSWDDL
ncbi:MAG TPA: hypothetical protein VF290_22705 [Pyrinomonadaceae bacterium]